MVSKKYRSTARKASQKLRQRAWDRKEWFCPCCGKRMWFPQHEPKIKRNKDPVGREAQMKALATLDHYVRTADGGTNEHFNLRIICQECNSGRHDEDEQHEIQRCEDFAADTGARDGWSEASGLPPVLDPEPSPHGASASLGQALVP